MTTQVTDDLKQFYDFIGKQLNNGGDTLSPEQVLERWRERLQTIESVNRGLDDVAAGRTKPVAEFVEDFESRHAIDSDA
jgi:hypothetical protein